MTDNFTTQLHELFAQLDDKKLRLDALENIKDLIITDQPYSVDEIKIYALRKLFRMLTLDDKSELEAVCEVLKLYLDSYEPGVLLIRFITQFMFALRHNEHCVEDIAIEEVNKTVGEDIMEYISDDIFIAVAQMVASPILGISKKAIKITSSLPERLYPKVLDQLEVVLQYDSSSKCNLFEVIINISNKSEDLLNLCEERGYLTFMLSELQGDDILYIINVLDLLSDLTTTSHGLTKLLELDGLNKIADLMANQVHSLDQMLLPGYIKFFASVSKSHPRVILEKYPLFFELLYNALDTKDESLIPLTLETLGFIGKTVEGKLSLAAVGAKYTTAIEKIGNLIRDSKIEYKIKALRCMASIIGYEDDPLITKDTPIDNRVVLMTREWFRSLSDKQNSMEMLCEICRNPFSDIMSAGIALLNAICQFEWGHQLVAKSPGFVEYLLDRRQVFDNNIILDKFEVIQKLSNSFVFDAETNLKLINYVELGPFYTVSTVDVAMEEGQN